MGSIEISTRFPDSTRPSGLLLTLRRRQDHAAFSAHVDRPCFHLAAEVFPLRFIRLVPERTGYWSFGATDVTEALDVTFQPLPANGPAGWWHRMHGIDVADLERGRGIRIGIIDEALERQSEESCIRHVENLGWIGATGEDASRGYEPRTEHGPAVTSLVSSTCVDTRGFQGVVPGAEVLFAAAGSESGEAGLSPARVANAIEYLVHVRQCDLINVSAGDLEEPIPEIEAAVQDAWDAGTLCFFPSGNRADQPIRYPARYPECLSVAAVGQRGFAPEATAEQMEDLVSPHEIAHGLYLWRKSSIGGGADFAAAGSNVVWSRNHRAARAVNGTSFASPIATGVSAALLAREITYQRLGRTAERSAHALEILRSACWAAAPVPASECEVTSGIRYGVMKVGVAATPGEDP